MVRQGSRTAPRFIGSEGGQGGGVERCVGAAEHPLASNEAREEEVGVWRGVEGCIGAVERPLASLEARGDEVGV